MRIALELDRRALLRRRIRESRRRLRASARPLLQAAFAAPLAWWLCVELLDNPAPIFAPLSALVAIGATIAQPWQRAAEIVIGVALGVAVADGMTLLIGQGTIQIGVLVFLAMATAVALGGRPMFVLQAGMAAALVAALPSQDGAASIDRIANTLVGGGCALLFTIVILPVRPLRLAHRAAGPVLEELSATFRQVGEALRTSDPQLAESALARARRTGDHWARLNEAVGIGRQAARIAPVRRHEESDLLDMAQSVTQLDYAIRDARVLARVAWRLTETQVPHGARLELVMQAFADAVQSIEGHLAGEYDATLVTRDAALRASRIASSIDAHEDDLVFTHLLGQVRSTTVDLLRVTAMPRGEAITRMLAAVTAGRAGQA
ncbi:MAG: FUSC family protein [Thermoleophilia bacterium]|nr:FUSC family protein [Thermoleophilia bacterium]